MTGEWREARTAMRSGRPFSRRRVGPILNAGKANLTPPWRRLATRDPTGPRSAAWAPLPGPWSARPACLVGPRTLPGRQVDRRARLPQTTPVKPLQALPRPGSPPISPYTLIGTRLRWRCPARLPHVGPLDALQPPLGPATLSIPVTAHSPRPANSLPSYADDPLSG